MNQKSAGGRHQIADGALADTGGPRADEKLILPGISTGPFTVQWLDEHWFIVLPGVAQRIEDARALESWLAAKGANARAELYFAGDRVLSTRSSCPSK